MALKPFLFRVIKGKGITLTNLSPARVDYRCETCGALIATGIIAILTARGFQRVAEGVDLRTIPGVLLWKRENEAQAKADCIRLVAEMTKRYGDDVTLHDGRK